MNELTSNPENNFLSREKPFELQRAERLWRFVAVTAAVWLVFSVYYLCNGLGGPALLSAACSIANFVLLACKRILKKSPFIVCHYFLLLCMIGIVSFCFTNGCAHRETIYFLPIGIFLASQLVGIRAALGYTIAVCLVISFIYLVGNPDQQPIVVDNNDSLNNALFFAICIFFICHQAESLFRQRTLRLKQLTEDLHLQNQQNHRLAITDALTGLSNRHGLSQIYDEHLGTAVSTGEELAMLVADFNGFKEVNDTHGHATGDELLKQIARRLEFDLGPGVFVGRLGGDEFCILAPKIGDSKAAMEFAGKVQETLSKPYDLNNEMITVGVSIGISLCPSQSKSSSELLSFADAAMYKAKFGSEKCVLFDPQMMDEIRSARELEEKLAAAVEKEEFYLVYQPQISFESGTAFGAEALIRWRHEGEDVLPWKFISALESSGLIIPVGRWVVEEACRQLAIWQKKGYEFAVSVNVSAAQFANASFVDEICQSIQRHGVNPALLDFEITESQLIEDFGGVIERLNAIKAIGCSISIDDFGTGYSSLAYLKKFPIDRLKIDREFVKDYPAADDGIVASSVVALAKALNLRVLAEGVETPEQYQFLRDCGCEEFQGFICSKPVAPEICEELFLEYNSLQQVKSLTSSLL